MTAKKQPRSRPKPVEPKEPDTSNNGDGNDDGNGARDDAPFYCPGCGRRHPFLRECTGMSATAPHPPIVVVSTDELDGDPEDFTPAPASGE